MQTDFRTRREPFVPAARPACAPGASSLNENDADFLETSPCFDRSETRAFTVLSLCCAERISFGPDSGRKPRKTRRNCSENARKRHVVKTYFRNPVLI